MEDEISNPLLVDTDGGIDDALALIFLAAHDRIPELVTTCFGNVALPQASENILDALELIECRCPVHAGCESPIFGPRINAEHVHGTDGLGGAARPNRKSTVTTSHAVDALRARLRLAMDKNRPVDILALGPLTNLALTYLLEPALFSGIARFVIMGGTHSGKGNVTETAEFNICADPEAAAVVLNSSTVIELVTWEPSVASAIDGNLIDSSLGKLNSSSLQNFAAALCNQSRKFNQTTRGEDTMIMADALAASVLLEPGIVTKSISCPVKVECSGNLTRGMTIPVRRPDSTEHGATVKVVESVDVAEFENFFERSMSWIDSL